MTTFFGRSSSPSFFFQNQAMVSRSQTVVRRTRNVRGLGECGGHFWAPAFQKRSGSDRQPAPGLIRPYSRNPPKGRLQRRDEVSHALEKLRRAAVPLDQAHDGGAHDDAVGG